MSVTVFSATRCNLGEGPLWHPEREELFWFDILEKRLHASAGDDERHWQFDEHVSAAGRIDRDSLLIASETGLYRFDIGTGERRLVVALEADDRVTRSNDGRADPWGGFWIGTMGKQAETGAGAIYRYYRGEIRKLVPKVTISNAICFAPDRSAAYYADTRIGRIMRQPLAAADGWPRGPTELFLDLGGAGFGADGAIVDSEGCLWNAQWGAGRVARYAADGGLRQVIEVPAAQTTCPAFGGPDLKTLYITTAADGTTPKTEAAGRTYTTRIDVAGRADPRVEIGS